MSDTQERIPVAMYRDVRDWLIEHDPDGRSMYDWACQEIGRPTNAEKCASEIIWIILCAGRSAQAARTIEAKVLDAIQTGKPVVDVFGYRKKAEAIESVWRNRDRHFDELSAIPVSDGEQLLVWCHAIPFIGDDTQYQLSRNFGADVCKPDIWLCRLAGIPDKPRKTIRERFRRCQAMCIQLSERSGDRVAAVDAMLWLGCNKRVLTVSATAGPVSFMPGGTSTRAAILS